MAEHDQAVGECANRMIAALRANGDLPAESMAEVEEIHIWFRGGGAHISTVWREIRGDDGSAARRRSIWVQDRSRDRSARDS